MLKKFSIFLTGLSSVHYPLPLSYVKPDAEKLKRLVQALREENGKLKEENARLRSTLSANSKDTEETERLKKE